MQVHDAENALVIVLDAHPVFERAEVISDVEISGRLHSGEDSCSHGKWLKFRGVTLIVSNFEVTVEKLVYGGDGLARLDGRVVFAPFVLPGERILARAEQEKPGMVRARMLEVLEAAPDRVVAPCPVYGRCGGCHYQHAPYEYQLAAKRAILVEALQRLGKMEPPAEIAVVAGEPFGYRNRVQLHVEENRLGYREGRSHKLCAVSECPVASPNDQSGDCDARGDAARRHGGRVSYASLEIFTDEREVQINVLETDRPVARRFFDWCGTLIPGLVEGALDYRGEFRVSSNSFFQVNRFLIDRLVEAATGGSGGRDGDRPVCGSGPAVAAAGPALPRGDGGGIGRGRGARSAIQRGARRPGESARDAADRGGASGAVREGAGFRSAGSAAHGVGQGGGGAVGGTAVRGRSRLWPAIRPRWRAIWRGWWRRGIV